MDEQLGALRTAPAGSAAGDVVEADGRRWRVETDALGGVLVPADRLWGAQTQRSLANFAIGTERMPHAVHHAYGLVKRAAAEVNARRGRLDPAIAEVIVAAADEVAAGALDDHLVLSVWQTGSGTQTNMNINEVVANRASVLGGGAPGTKSPVHPNDHVNKGQSSNDTFPTAVHVAAVLEVRDALRPQMDALAAAIDERASRWHDVVKIGRTHLQDATPLTVGQERHAWASLLRADAGRLDDAVRGLHPLAIGGTAVGTGTGSPEGFGPDVAAVLAQLTGEPFTAADAPFAAL